MAAEQELPEIKVDMNSLYREEVFTDRKAGTIRCLIPIDVHGAADASRPVLYSGQTQLLTPGGVLPLSFDFDAKALAEACEQFPAAVKTAIEQAIAEAQEMRRESSSRIVVPEVGAGGAGPSGGGRIKF